MHNTLIYCMKASLFSDFGAFVISKLQFLQKTSACSAIPGVVAHALVLLCGANSACSLALFFQFEDDLLCNAASIRKLERILLCNAGSVNLLCNTGTIRKSERCCVMLAQ